jgi:LCP family protein required for cell wall assembly
METEVRNKKKRLSTGKIIIVAILLLLILLIVGFGAFTLFKLYRMRMGAIATVPKPTVAPYAVVTPEPGVIIATGDPDDLTQDIDDPIDPGLIAKDPIYVENAIDPDVVNILVMGEDKSADKSTGRSDVMILVSYNQRTNNVKAVSILRDTWIYIPGRDTWNRVNAAYRFGGIGLAINTINANFELDIQYYMLTDFEKLIGIVDELGGLDMTLNASEIEYYNSSPDNPSTIRPDENGRCHLNGAQVLMHCRNRTIGNGDWSRTERQRQVLTAFYERALREQDAAALTSLIYRLMDYVETNMSPWQMISIATSVVFNARGGMERASIPCSGSWSYAYERGMAVIHIDIEQNKQWLHNFIYGAN